MTFSSLFRIIHGMKQYKQKPWTQSERTILRDNYYIVSKEELLDMLPDRTLQSITSQVYYLKKRGWYFKRGNIN